MIWDDITPSREVYGADYMTLADYFDTYNDKRAEADQLPAENPTEIFVIEARAEVLRDLQVELGLNPGVTLDMARISAITDYNATRVEFAIALQQLILMYDDLGGGDGSLNSVRLSRLRKRYDAERAGFKGYGTPTGRVGAIAVSIYG